VETAWITDLKRFAVHDGPGIRTTVFFKGCSLACRWCHNPENISFSRELAYFSHKCRHCGLCATLCQAHTVEEGQHRFDRRLCVQCGRCAEACPAEALRLYGREVTVDGLFDEVMEDAPFYAQSSGGVTLSGGECLCQPDFCAALLKKLKEAGVHTAVDTCGQVSRRALEETAAFTDLYLYDIKAFSEEVHHRATGHGNRQILENLRYLDALGKAIEIRIPLVPGYNEDQLPEIGALLSQLPRVTCVRVLAYHRYAAYKYPALGRENLMGETPAPTEEQLSSARQTLERFGLRVEE